MMDWQMILQFMSILRPPRLHVLVLESESGDNGGDLTYQLCKAKVVVGLIGFPCIILVYCVCNIVSATWNMIL